MNIFVINLDRATDRWSYFDGDEKYTRWTATDCNDIKDDDPILKQMFSPRNINPKEHRAKCACYLSHTSLWRHIVENKLNDILILEDDAQLVGEIPDTSELPKDGFTYLGGLTFNKSVTKGPIKVDLQEGINTIDIKKYRVLMLMSYYIPHWSIAHKMLEAIDEKCQNARPHGIDITVNYTKTPRYLYYPAPFIERNNTPSQIRENKKKHSNIHYEWIRYK